MAVKVGITGPIGSIKTEALNKIMEMLKNDGKVIEGTLVSEKYEHGRVTSYYITDILLPLLYYNLSLTRFQKTASFQHLYYFF